MWYIRKGDRATHEWHQLKMAQRRKHLARMEATRNGSPGNQSSTTEPFRLPELPRELRNYVYEKALDIYAVAHLSRLTSDKNLLTDCRLVAVSKQVRSEFMDVMNLHVPIIRTRVRNFDFGAVIAYFNRIPDAVLNKLLADTNATTRVIKIELDYSILGCLRQTDKLNRWLKRVDDPSKKGFGVKVQYEWVPNDWPGNRELRVWSHAKGVKGKEEWEKIQNAPCIENFQEEEDLL